MTPVLSALTLRQEQVLDLLADGLTNKEIAARLGISWRTVERHVSDILVRLGATTRSGAVSLYLRSRAA